MADGPYPKYQATESDVSAEAAGIRSLLGSIETEVGKAKSIHRSGLGSFGGAFFAPYFGVLEGTEVAATDLDQAAEYAAGCLIEWSSTIQEYNTSRGSYPRSIAQLNEAYLSTAPKPTLDPVEKTKSFEPEDYAASRAARAKLEKEYEDLVDWMKSQGRQVATMLDQGWTKRNVSLLWLNGSLHSSAPDVFTGAGLGNLSPLVTPYDLRDLSLEELKEQHPEIPWSKITALSVTVDAKVLLPVYRLLSAGRSLESAVSVQGDGSITFKLSSSIIAGFAIPGLSLSRGHGGSASVTFEDEEAMLKFLQDVHDAITADLDGGDVRKPWELLDDAAELFREGVIEDPTVDAAQIAMALKEHHVQVWGHHERDLGVGANLGPAEIKGAISNKAEVLLLEFKDGEFSAGDLRDTVTVENGVEIPGIGASGEIEAQATYHMTDGKVDLSLSTTVSVSDIRDRGLSGLTVSETESHDLKMQIEIEDATSDPELNRALMSGDIEAATKRAYEIGTVQITHSESQDGRIEADKTKSSGVVAEGGLTVSSTKSTWIKPPGSDSYRHVTPEDYPG